MSDGELTDQSGTVRDEELGSLNVWREGHMICCNLILNYSIDNLVASDLMTAKRSGREARHKTNHNLT